MKHARLFLQSLQTSSAWQLLMAAFVGIGSVSLLIDAAGSSTSVLRMTGYASPIVATVCVIGFGLVRWHSGQRLPVVFEKVGWMGGLLAVLSATFLTVWTYFSQPNVVYSLTRLNPEIILSFGNFLLVGVLLNQSAQWWRKNVSLCIMIVPFWVLAVSWLIRLLPFDLFWRFVAEDGPVEYVQVGILLAAVLFSWKQAQGLFKKHRSKAAVFLVLGMAMLFFLLEEISWGQRIFGWETPEELGSVNVQNETTLHNIGIMNQLQLVGYIGLSAMGSFLCWRPIASLQKLRLPFPLWSPPRAALFLFLIPLVFYISFVAFSTPYHWAEIIEVLFYAALLCWIAGESFPHPKNSSSTQ